VIKLSALISILTLLTACATPTNPVGLDAIIDSTDMVWLGVNLDNEEWQRLEGWLKYDLIPYVTELETER